MASFEYNIKHILSCTIILRGLQFLIVYYTPCQFDTSTAIFVETFNSTKSMFYYPEFIKKTLYNLMSWDSVYFLKLSLIGINFEHEWVFGPLWWRLMHSLVIRYSLSLYDIQSLFIIINNILLVGVTYITYNLSFHVCVTNKSLSKINPYKFAYITSLLVIIQPSGIFSVVSYTETVVQFLSFLGIYYYLKSKSIARISDHINYFFSGSLFSIAFGIRSNCLLFGIVYLFDLTEFKQNISDIMCILITGSQLLGSLIISIYIPYKKYCPERGEWCNTWSKSLLSYSQNHYWNVGFLNYFTSGNIPLFLISIPQLLIISLAIIKFWKFSNLKSLNLMFVVYLFLQFTTMHVQIVNRISTFIPIHLWYVSLCFIENKKISIYIIKFWIFWVLLQTALFSSFLPPA